MCGRYTLTREEKRIREKLAYEATLPLFPRFNIAPSQDAPVIAPGDSGPILKLMRWGLVPSWAKDEKIGYKMINAKAETVAEKPAYRKSFQRRRCLAPADGFYEWKKVENGKQPFRFTLQDGDTFAFAGLWDRWERADGSVLESFAIITTEPNELARTVHDRMPAIVSPNVYEQWLDPTFHDADSLRSVLGPYPATQMSCYPVSSVVNNARNDTPACIAPLAAP